MGVGGGYCGYRGKKTTIPILSLYAQKKKARYFLDGIPKYFRILEVGCGNGWAGNYLKTGGWEHYVGLDLVSYTHLRAHETRHDLVCRLLLEKKKKQKYNNS